VLEWVLNAFSSLLELLLKVNPCITGQKVYCGVSHLGLLGIRIFVFDKEIDELLVVVHLLLFQRNDHLDVFLEALQVLYVVAAVSHEVIDLLVVALKLEVSRHFIHWHDCPEAGKQIIRSEAGEGLECALHIIYVGRLGAEEHLELLRLNRVT